MASATQKSNADARRSDPPTYHIPGRRHGSQRRTSSLLYRHWSLHHPKTDKSCDLSCGGDNAHQAPLLQIYNHQTLQSNNQPQLLVSITPIHSTIKIGLMYQSVSGLIWEYRLTYPHPFYSSEVPYISLVVSSVCSLPVVSSPGILQSSSAPGEDK